MRKSYIADSSEALNLHNGTQTAIVVKMYKQPDGEPASLLDWAYGLATHCHPTPTRQQIEDKAKQLKGIIFPFRSNKTGRLFSPAKPYALGQEVYVRESWIYRHKHDKYYYKADHSEFEPYCHKGWKSPATMPKDAARTRFIPVSCEAVRVKEMTEEQAKLLCLELYKNLDGTFGGHGAPTTYKAQFQYYAIAKFGKSAWDENHFIWLYKIYKK